MVYSSTGRLRFREFPFSAEYLGTRTIEPDGVIPALRDRKTVWNLAVATAELDCDRAIVALLRRDIVERIGVVRVLFVVARFVVDADRPERLDGHLLDVESVDGLAV